MKVEVIISPQEVAIIKASCFLRQLYHDDAQILAEIDAVEKEKDAAVLSNILDRLACFCNELKDELNGKD